MAVLITSVCLLQVDPCPCLDHTVSLSNNHWLSNEENCKTASNVLLFFTVRFPRSTADLGVCILQYAMSVSSLNAAELSLKSFNQDGHYSTIKENHKCMFNDSDLHHLRLDCIRLVCSVASKYNTVRKISNVNSCQCLDNHNCPHATTSDSSSSDTSQDAMSSSDDDASVSSCQTRDSDSTFHIDIDETELDYSDDLYNSPVPDQHSEVGDTGSVEEMYSDFWQETTPSPCEYSRNIHASTHDDDLTDSEDDDSVEEMYSDYQTKNTSSGHATSPIDNEGEGNNERADAHRLICPGDVLEYCLRRMGDLPKKNSVMTIVDTRLVSYVILKNGQILQPDQHSVWKIKVYCSNSGTLLPTPESTWHRLDKCLLQAGSLFDYEEEVLDHGHDDDDTSAECINQNKRNKRR